MSCKKEIFGKDFQRNLHVITHLVCFLMWILPWYGLFTRKVWIGSHLARSWVKTHSALHSFPQTLIIFYCSCILYCSYGEETSVDPTRSGGLEKVKWSRDTDIYFTLVTVHWADASLGPVGFGWRRAQTCTDHWCIPAGLFWVTARDNMLVYLEDWWKFQKQKIQHQALRIYIHVAVDVWIIMQSTDMVTPNSCFLKGGLATHSWETWRELHHPQSLRAAKNEPVSHNMSDIYSTEEWPLTASSPLARREITFICHNWVLQLYSRMRHYHSTLRVR